MTTTEATAVNHASAEVAEGYRQAYYAGRDDIFLPADDAKTSPAMREARRLGYRAGYNDRERWAIAAARLNADLFACPDDCTAEHSMLEIEAERMVHHIIPAVRLEFSPERGEVGDPTLVSLNVHRWVYNDEPAETGVCIDDDLPMFLDGDVCQALATAFQQAARKLAEVIAE